MLAQLDARVGPRGRSRFIAQALKMALGDEGRWDSILAAIGSIPDTGHEWDEDPAAWVHDLRRASPRDGA
jgi:hypothetical protein